MTCAASGLTATQRRFAPDGSSRRSKRRLKHGERQVRHGDEQLLRGSDMKGFVLGIFITIAVALAGAYVFVTSGALPVGQDVKPGKLERWIAKTSLRATIGRQTTGLTNPLPPTDDNFAAAVPLYIAHCQICHGGPDGAAS